MGGVGIDSTAGRMVARLSRVRAGIETWWYGDSASAAIGWGIAIVLLAAVLVWFFVFSPYGAPAAPVYAEF